MKSFDEMADDFVTVTSENIRPTVLTDRDRKLLWIGYISGLGAGVEFCAYAIEPEKEAR